MRLGVILGVLLFGALCWPVEDLVNGELPGGCKLDTHMFSGYLPISSSKNIHYVFVESKGKWNEDPLMVILDGGPGCSAMQTLFFESGPCVIDTEIYPNPYSFNNRTNLLYIEAPAGVGFSTSSDPLFYNDQTAADDNILALHKFFEKFPEYLNRDLYV
jgi:carboxypeptidase C (cathepsin A)